MLSNRTMQLTEQQYYSIEEYLTLEESADYKSEYIDGEIFPIACGSTNHNRIAGNFYAALNFAFKTEDYDVFMSDVRLWIPKKRIYTYPDVMVVCGKPEYYSTFGCYEVRRQYRKLGQERDTSKTVLHNSRKCCNSRQFQLFYPNTLSTAISISGKARIDKV